MIFFPAEFDVPTPRRFSNYGSLVIFGLLVALVGLALCTILIIFVG